MRPEGPAFNRPGRQAGIGVAENGAPKAAISEGRMIRLLSPKAEIQFEVIEPWDAGIDVFSFEDVRQVLIVFF